MVDPEELTTSVAAVGLIVFATYVVDSALQVIGAVIIVHDQPIKTVGQVAGLILRKFGADFRLHQELSSISRSVAWSMHSIATHPPS